QEKADSTMQGRTFGLLGSMYSGFLPIGMAIFGPMSDAVSLQLIMVGSGIALILIATFIAANKTMRSH
ncbi:MAG: MFS transporter, partial [Christensenellaceae bacterium]